MMLILVLYDAHTDVAYWLYIQAYFQQQTHFDLDLIGETVTLYLDRSNVLDEAAIRRFARFKADILRQRPEDFRYEF